MNACAYALCGTAPARPYPVGWRCGDHTPAALLGLPEPPSLADRGERPTWVDEDGAVKPLPLIGFRVQDARAVAKGQRVSGERRRAMQAAEAYEAANA